MFDIEVGDRVQARKQDGTDVAVVEFTVTGIEGGTYTGSPLGPLDTGDGWTVELIRRGDPNLPDTLSDLAAWLVYEQSTPARIVGPLPGTGHWQTSEGNRVDPADVLAWMPWAEYTPPEPEPIEQQETHDD